MDVVAVDMDVVAVVHGCSSCSIWMKSLQYMDVVAVVYGCSSCRYGFSNCGIWM